MSDWINAPDNPMGHFGFVYVITHKEGPYYVGSCQFKRKVRRKPLKGQKRKRICWVESKWKSYWGSSKNLLEAVEQEGKDAFVREIASVHESRFDLSYAEAQLQFDLNVLQDKMSWNGIIQIRLGKPVGDPIAHARKNRNER